MWQAALDAADYALLQCEARLDRVLGRELRLALGRYAAVLFLGFPVAWMLGGFHWNGTAKLGLIFGVFLYALIDIVRHKTVRPPAEK